MWGRMSGSWRAAMKPSGIWPKRMRSFMRSNKPRRPSGRRALRRPLPRRGRERKRSRSAARRAVDNRPSLRVLITAGPTREPLDPVRFISNYSTGYMGARLAGEALRRGHRVTIIRGPASEPMPKTARVIAVERAREMARALRREAPRADAIIMAAAVADYTPVRLVRSKIKRAGRKTLRLRATPDLIGRLPRRKGQLVAGFALETDRAIPRARAKLREKRLDLIVAQRVPPPKGLVGERAAPARGPFGRQRVRAWLLERAGAVTPLGRVPKPRIARALLDKLEALWYGQQILK